MQKRISKYNFLKYVSKKSGYTIHKLHIFAIINILIDEMIKELKTGKPIKIEGFGTFHLNSLKPKKIRSVYSKKIKFAQKTKSLRFKLTKDLSKYLIEKSIKDMKDKIKWEEK
jgi:nucleoid DNA-binding protein